MKDQKQVLIYENVFFSRGAFLRRVILAVFILAGLWCYQVDATEESWGGRSEAQKISPITYRDSFYDLSCVDRDNGWTSRLLGDYFFTHKMVKRAGFARIAKQR